MTAEGVLGTEGERAAQRLIEQVGAMAGDVPGGFAAQLFGRVSAEDLLVYEPRELALLAQQAWAFLQVREPGTARIRVDSPSGLGGAARLNTVSVIEIVNDDMPFLLDSVMGELTERGIEIRLVAHPIFTVERDAAGTLLEFHGQSAAAGAARRESFIHIHIDRIEEDARREQIVGALAQVLGDVRVCVEDWRPMLDRVGELIAGLRDNPPPLPADQVAEAVQLLEWLIANNFTFLGAREYVLTDDGTVLDQRAESGLGVLRDPEKRVLRRSAGDVHLTPEARAFFEGPQMLIISKANTRSRVHRRVHMDYVGVKRFDPTGRLQGELRIVGLFTSTAYTRSARTIPYLRRKVAATLQRAGFDPDSHSGKALANVLESYPRDDLFQIDEDTLFVFAMAILQLEERPRMRVLPRRDRFDRFVSVLVFVQRERFNSAAREAIGRFLAEAYKGRVSAFYPFFPEGPLVRVHFIIARDPGEAPDPSRADLEQAVTDLVRTWMDAFVEALAQAHEPGQAGTLAERYGNAFSAAYREAFSPATAVADIRVLEGLSPERPLSVDFHRLSAPDAERVGLKVWSRHRAIPLSERVPALENMGFNVVEESTYRIETTGDRNPDVWLHAMILDPAEGGAIDLDAAGPRLEACFLMVLRGQAENDGYNALVLTAGLGWREAALLRAISRFLRQARVAFSQDYMWTTLRKHSAMAAQVVKLFHTRFDPRLELSAEERQARESTMAADIERALDQVASLDEDRILRHFVNAVQAALRTSFYQLESAGQAKPTIAVKFASRRVEELPLPRPLYEIFVYSPRVEGVHLRFGKVARGGIRWSDRPQDFRTEVLGLVKAQQVKNAVIVPVGAKGGFVPKWLPLGGTREAVQEEGKAAYTLFVSSLLDITDNFGPDAVVPPFNVVRHDGDDPYLVVAADKGTATFSDLANRIAADYDFWLGDAFASGGSAGYDHKKMGITARGAWVAVQRHFREMGVDIQTTPFRVAGIGDMSGDVFGNGMLCARTIKLVAAFDHRDIFIDPDPDPETSYQERKRLFDLPRSSWSDYDRRLMSQGGGVFARTLKEIELSSEAQAALGLPREKAAPHNVIKAILKMPVDLLWFGGIGTYVRASSESNEEVGDRGNDAVRVTGAELKCKVIGEGGNLGMTQRGRIEAALNGVRLNTDAIDNSAGVNTSDLEVNIKIALNAPLRDGRLTPASREDFLMEMTDEVASLVLRNNYLQTLALSLAQRRGVDDLGFQQRLMQTLEGRGLLDRALEFLPDDMAITERQRRGQGLTRPELAILLAYAKLTLQSELLDSTVPDDPYLGHELGRYFPKPMSERFPDAVERHRLRREIISTQLANSMINRGGPSLVVRIADQTGASVARVAAAFAAVRDSYEMTDLNGAIDALDGHIDGKVQLMLYAAVQDLLLDCMLWFLRNADVSQGLAAVVEHYRGGIQALAATLETVLPAGDRAALAGRQSELQELGVPQALAQRIASLGPLAAAPDVVLIAERTGRPVEDVAATYFAAGAFFRLDRILGAARGIAVSDYFDRLALDRTVDAIGDAERRLAAEMMANGAAGPQAVDAWVAPRAAQVERIRAAIDEIAGPGLTLSRLSVAASLLGDLVKRGA